jgi:hypothetical protein
VPRTPDPRVPPTEPLYRSLSVHDMCNGHVSDASLDGFPCVSFNRGEYSLPHDVIVAGRPSDNGIGEITGNELPGPFARSTGAQPDYVYIVQDAPNPPEDPSNDAHCEVQLIRQGQRYSKNHTYDKPAKRLARELLARRIRIYLPPS